MPASWINCSTFNFTVILNSTCRYDSCKYSETVGSIMRQEAVEIRNLKRTQSFSPLIKPIIPTKAGKTMNSTKKKNYSISWAYLKAKIRAVVTGLTVDISQRQRSFKCLIKKMMPVCSDKTGKKNASKVPVKCSSYSSSHCVSRNDSLSYSLSKMELEIDKMGLELLFPAM